MIADAVEVPLIASGGAGTPQHLVDVFNIAGADAGLIASMVHFGTYTIPSIKQELAQANIPMRMKY